MPILPQQAQRPRHGATRVAISGGLVAVQALIAVTLFTLLAGRAEGSPAAERHGAAKPTAEARRAARAGRAASAEPGVERHGEGRAGLLVGAGARRGQVRVPARRPTLRSSRSCWGSAGRRSRPRNTFASVDKTLADGNYFWRVRAIDKRDRAGRWTRGPIAVEVMGDAADAARARRRRHR